MATPGGPSGAGVLAPAIRRERHFGDRTVRCYASRPVSLGEMLDEACGREPEALAIVDGERRLTWGDVGSLTERLAGHLHARGLTAGERLVAAMVNRAEHLLLLLACARLGAIFVPVNVREGRDGFAHVIADCTPRVLVLDEAAATRLPPAPETPSVRLRLAVDEASHPHVADSVAAFLAKPAAAQAPRHAGDEEDTVVLLYTSGTTGAPKAAMLSHLNIIHTAMHFCSEWCLGAGDRAMLVVPASHVTGLVAILATMLRAGGCTIVARTFEPEAFLALASAERMTTTVLVPAMYNLCLLRANLEEHDLSRWRIGGFGGAPMPPATVEALADRLPGLELLNAYGSTECTSATHLVPVGQSARSATSVGPPAPCCEQRIVDASGAEAVPGAIGEVWLRGPNTVRGYWGRRRESAESFVDGFWRSGDLGSVEPDGYLRLFDRLKDVVNRGGYKVSSAALEAVLLEHPAIAEAAVVGHADEVLGEKVHAFVVRADAALDAAGTRAHCAGHVADYMVPDHVTFVDGALPRNANGKLRKEVLRAMSRDGG